jgi:uncharacterized membrane protein
MRMLSVLGVVLVLGGLLLLYLLRDLVLRIIIFLLEFLGIVVAIAFILIGLGLIFWPGRRRRAWRLDI